VKRPLLCLALALLSSCGDGTEISKTDSQQANIVGTVPKFEPDYFLVRVTAGAGRLPLCRAPFDGTCVGKSYLIPGNFALASEASGEYLFIDYVSPTGTASFGWVDGGKVERLRLPPDRTADWVARWQLAANIISISPTKPEGYLMAEGAGSSVSHDRIQGEHTTKSAGEFLVKFEPRNNHAAFGVGKIGDSQTGVKFRDEHGRKHKTVAYDGEGANICQLKLQRIGTYLVVEDNRQCGWPNFTFDGVYRKQGG
jgi:hypothetical protein